MATFFFPVLTTPRECVTAPPPAVQITFSMLVFPSEHHALGFSVAAAATGSCVLKLGVGWLMGEPGEIFKILDDPLGDRCHASRCAG